jgi:hypothetical protein
MDEFIYNLFLRSRGGLTLLGTLRYRLTGIEVGMAPDTGVFSLPAARQVQQGRQVQQAPQQIDSIFAIVLRADGTVTLPFLSGLQPVPVSDFAFFIQMGPPLLTRLISADSRILIAFNQINNQQIGGHLVWGPTNTTFGLLGRRVILPA